MTMTIEDSDILKCVIAALVEQETGIVFFSDETKVLITRVINSKPKKVRLVIEMEKIDDTGDTD